MYRKRQRANAAKASADVATKEAALDDDPTSHYDTLAEHESVYDQPTYDTGAYDQPAEDTYDQPDLDTGGYDKPSDISTYDHPAREPTAAYDNPLDYTTYETLHGDQAVPPSDDQNDKGKSD